MPSQRQPADMPALQSPHQAQTGLLVIANTEATRVGAWWSSQVQVSSDPDAAMPPLQDLCVHCMVQNTVALLLN